MWKFIALAFLRFDPVELVPPVGMCHLCKSPSFASEVEYAIVSRLAERGDPEASFRIARHIEWEINFGSGPRDDDAKALYWFWRASNDGHKAAASQVALWLAMDSDPVIVAHGCRMLQQIMNSDGAELVTEESFLEHCRKISSDNLAR